MDAIDDLGDAIDVSREFLTPVSLGFWLKLAVVVFFVSSLGFGGLSFPGGDVGTFLEDPTIETPEGEEFEELEGETEGEFEIDFEAILTTLLVIGAGLLALWLLYAAIAGIMEFVFLESLRSKEVRLGRYFGANVGKGLRLFLFRLGLLAALIVLAGAPAVYVMLATDGGLAGLSGGLFALYSLYGVGVYLVYTIARRFTDEFVAPIMLLEDRGVLSSWSRFWGTMTGNWREYAVYLVIVWILYIAVSIAVWIFVGFGLFAVMIPIVIVMFLLLTLGPIGGILALLTLLIGIIVAALFAALVWTPITTYFRYYALLVLGDTNDEFDLIPAQRAAVRADDEPDAAAGAAVDRTDSRGSSAWDDGTDADPWDDDSSGDPWDDASDRDDDPDSWDDEHGGPDSWDDPDDTDRSPWDDASDRDDRSDGSDRDRGDGDEDDDRTW